MHKIFYEIDSRIRRNGKKRHKAPHGTVTRMLSIIDNDVELASGLFNKLLQEDGIFLLSDEFVATRCNAHRPDPHPNRKWSRWEKTPPTSAATPAFAPRSRQLYEPDAARP